MIRQIGDLLLSREGKSLNEGQGRCLELFESFAEEEKPRGVFLLKGAAGTGKTSLIRILVQYLKSKGRQVFLLAPTGRAAKVVSSRSRMYAATLHRHMYQVDEGQGGMAFFLRHNPNPRDCWYIVDEASMIGNQSEGTRSGLLDDFFRFAWEGSEQRKIVMVGDPYQLPPVGAENSPALNADAVAAYTGHSPRVFELFEVMRQEEGSGILGLAEQLRDALISGQRPEINPETFSDVRICENLNSAIEEVCSKYEQGVNDKVSLITYSNGLATRANLSMRFNLYGAEEALVKGEPVMVVRNNYAFGDKQFPFIANGELGTVLDVFFETYEEKYGLKWMDVVIGFQGMEEEPVRIECKVILDLLTSKQANLDYKTLQRVMQERRRELESESLPRLGERIRKDPYINGLQIKYGYAMTGHKAQGGQWKNVFVCFEGQMPGMSETEYLRWAYTAVTRAEERLEIVGWPFYPREAE